MNLSSPWQCLRCRVAAARRQFSSSSSARGSAETYQKRRFRRGETEGQAKYTPDADGHRSKRERSFGGRALPVTPVLDPKVIEARARWRGPKDPPPKASELTPFQQELWANPHAHALATSVRSCCFTGTRVPSYFLLGFGAVFIQPSIENSAAPDANRTRPKSVPYILPNLPIGQVLGIAAPTSKRSSSSPDLDAGANTAANAADNGSVEGSSSSSTAQAAKSQRQTYILNSRGLVDRLGKRRSYARLVQGDFAANFGITKPVEFQWVDDMEDMVLRGLRNAAFKKLAYHFQVGKDKVGEGLVWEEKVTGRGDGASADDNLDEEGEEDEAVARSDQGDAEESNDDLDAFMSSLYDETPSNPISSDAQSSPTAPPSTEDQDQGSDQDQDANHSSSSGFDRARAAAIALTRKETGCLFVLHPSSLATAQRLARDKYHGIDVFDLPHLLGESELERFLAGRKYEGVGIVGVANRQPAVAMRMALGRVEMYLRDHEDDS